jgi:diacylglycerol kinase (ATP)
VQVFRNERHMRFHFWSAIVISLLAAAVRVPLLELLFVWSAIILVIIAEMFNTAIEDLVDLAARGWSEKAGRVKDIAAGIVLAACVYAAAVFVLVFFRAERITEYENLLGALAALLTGGRSEFYGRAARSMLSREIPIGELTATGLVMLALLIVILKERVGLGRFASGGWVSGHAAVSFFLATMIAFGLMNAWVAGAAYALASLVAQSRVEGHIHTWAESIRGAAIGAVLGIALFVLGAVTVTG